MAYDKLNQYLNSKGLKLKAEKNVEEVDKIKSIYTDKSKAKSLTQSERLDRIEKILGLQ